MTCLLRDGRDLLPAWHRLKTDNDAAARRLHRGRTWGHLRVRPVPLGGTSAEAVVCWWVDGAGRAWEA